MGPQCGQLVAALTAMSGSKCLMWKALPPMVTCGDYSPHLIDEDIKWDSLCNLPRTSPWVMAEVAV